MATRADDLISAAIARGECDNLPHKGQPIRIAEPN